MLIRFAVENYMSFKEQQVFSMAAGKGSRHPSHIISINDNRLLKSSFLFGANAAGKSNFIHAVDFMRRTVVAGSSKAGKTRDRYFRIDAQNLGFKYGGEITCVGMITNIIGEDTDPNDSQNIFATLQFSVNEVLRQLLPTKERNLCVIHPIAVYYGN